MTERSNECPLAPRNVELAFCLACAHQVQQRCDCTSSHTRYLPRPSTDNQKYTSTGVLTGVLDWARALKISFLPIVRLRRLNRPTRTFGRRNRGKVASLRLDRRRHRAVAAVEAQQAPLANLGRRPFCVHRSRARATQRGRSTTPRMRML